MLLGVDIDINTTERHFKEQHESGMTSMKQDIAESLPDSMSNQAILDHTSIDKKELPVSLRAVVPWFRNPAAKTEWAALFIDVQCMVDKFTAEYGSETP